jgi:hypothetical protein
VQSATVRHRHTLYLNYAISDIPFRQDTSRRTSALLRFDEPRRAINANNQTSRNLGIKSTTVTRLFNAEDSSKPCDNFVRRRVGWFVQVDNTRPVGG